MWSMVPVERSSDDRSQSSDDMFCPIIGPTFPVSIHVFRLLWVRHVAKVMRFVSCIYQVQVRPFAG